MILEVKKSTGKKAWSTPEVVVLKGLQEARIAAGAGSDGGVVNFNNS